MDFGWSAAQDELYDRISRYSSEQLNIDIAARAREGTFSREAWRRAGEFGLLGLCVPSELGGLGLDALGTARAEEAFGRGCRDLGLVFSAGAHLFAGTMPLAEHAAPALARRWVPELAAGRAIAANAITEAEAGSDVTALRARAVCDGDGYVLDGAKIYVTNAPVADLFVVYASTAPEHGYLGLSAFVVERGAAGVTVGPPMAKMGLTTSPMAALYLDGCRVPASQRLGEEGQGAAIFQASMRWERTCLFAGFLGAIQRQLDEAVAYATERKQGRRAIGKNQAISHRLVDLKLRVDAARLLLYRACWLVDQRADATEAIAMAKLAVSETAIEVGLGAIQVHGGLGYMVDAGVEVALRDAVPLTIFSGTSEIQRNVIAARMGL